MEQISGVLEKFVQDKTLSKDELKLLGNLFSDRTKQPDVEKWLKNNWELSSDKDLEIDFGKLRSRIRNYSGAPVSGTKSNIRKLANYYRKIAAILFIPFAAGLCYLAFITSSGNTNYYVSEAPLGQKAKIELPDSSTVWLNSGSSIRYSSEFNKKNREIDLTGEAFFEVHKDKGKPFIVNTRYLAVKVTGTQFNVNAYDDEPVVETALVKGKVNLMLTGRKKQYQMDPGEVLSYSKESHQVTSSELNKEATIGWKENRLIFINDDFSKLVRKMEKWFDVTVIYNPDDFKNNKLTVRLLEGEQLDQLLRIIETAIGAKCIIVKNKIYIKKV